jgi:hypothetical protein
MARGGGAELGKAVPTPWRAISACPWSIFDTGAASPDGDGADWRRQWSPDGDGGDACPDGGGGGGGYAAALFGGGCGREQHRGGGAEVFGGPYQSGGGHVKPGLTLG